MNIFVSFMNLLTAPAMDMLAVMSKNWFAQRIIYSSGGELVSNDSLLNSVVLSVWHIGQIRKQYVLHSCAFPHADMRDILKKDEYKWEFNWLVFIS